MMQRADTSGTEDLVADGKVPDGGQITQTAEERDELVSKIGDSSFFHDSDDDDDAVTDPDDSTDLTDDQDAAAKAAADEAGKDTGEEDGDADADETDDAGETDDKVAEEGQAVKGDGEPEPTPDVIPAAMRRSLKADQWTDEEISDFYALDPERAMKTFERTHGNRMALMAEYSAIGRRSKNAESVAAADGGQRQTATEAVAAGSFPVVDVAAVVDQFGEENAEIVKAVANAVAGPVNTAIERINEVWPTLQRGVKASEEAEQAAGFAVIDTFFKSNSLKAYAGLYGDSTKGRTPAQDEKYAAVLEEADAMIAGAAYQGRQLSAEDALEAAHHAVSADFKMQAVRTDLKTKTKKRAAGTTLKPTNRGKTKTASRGRAKTQKEAIDKVRDGLIKVGFS